MLTYACKYCLSNVGVAQIEFENRINHDEKNHNTKIEIICITCVKRVRELIIILGMGETQLRHMSEYINSIEKTEAKEADTKWIIRQNVDLIEKLINGTASFGPIEDKEFP